LEDILVPEIFRFRILGNPLAIWQALKIHPSPAGALLGCRALALGLHRAGIIH